MIPGIALLICLYGTMRLLNDVLLMNVAEQKFGANTIVSLIFGSCTVLCLWGTFLLINSNGT